MLQPQFPDVMGDRHFLWPENHVQVTLRAACHPGQLRDRKVWIVEVARNVGLDSAAERLIRMNRGAVFG